MALSGQVAGMDLPGKVVPAEDWHITLRFLGPVDTLTYERFLHGLQDLGEVGAFRVGLDGFGAFPNPRKATVFWAGLGVGVDGLARLNEVCEEAARGTGLEPEERPFRPHLTLSRIRPPTDVRLLLEDELTLSWTCDRVVVFESHREGGSGVRYESLEVFRLGTG